MSHKTFSSSKGLKVLSANWAAGWPDHHSGSGWRLRATAFGGLDF